MGMLPCRRRHRRQNYMSETFQNMYIYNNKS